MKYLLPFLILQSVFQFTNGQTQNNPDSDIEKWVHAIVNLEVRASFEKFQMEQTDLYEHHKISWDSLQEIFHEISYGNFAWTATAIFLLYKHKHFLITARHVLADPTKDDSSGLSNKIILIENPSSSANDLSHTSIDSSGNMLKEWGAENIMLMNYQAMPIKNYALSIIKNDLGIIYLDGDHQGREFIKTLEKRRYKAIKIDDIDTLCKIKANQKIIAFGFPVESLVYQKNGMPSIRKLWESTEVTVPAVSFGSISNSQPDSAFFTGNIFVYHGFSGGPIIRDNKLVGITHGGSFDIKGNNNILGTYKLCQCIFIKSSLIMPLLRIFDEEKSSSR